VVTSAPDSDRRFTGSVAQIYESLLVPMIFAPCALDMAARAAARRPARVLELAAGTGVVTRALDAILPVRTRIVATDLNQAMLDQAIAVGGTRERVEWRQADAMALPFADGEFDLVVCQFGVMFFPDKGQAFAEARRVLAPGGSLLFNVWDEIAANEFAAVVTEALARWWFRDPPMFLARTPHGYHERARIEADLLRGGFTTAPIVDTFAARGLAAGGGRGLLRGHAAAQRDRSAQARWPRGSDEGRCGRAGAALRRRRHRRRHPRPRHRSRKIGSDSLFRFASSKPE
jgi:SAM-dependent methyltransferase